MTDDDTFIAITYSTESISGDTFYYVSNGVRQTQYYREPETAIDAWNNGAAFKIDTEADKAERNAFYLAHGFDTTPSWNGEKIDQGRLIPYRVFPGEGYAVLRCGNTEVVLSYTLLNHLNFELESKNSMWGAVAAASKALKAITAEASIGRNGDEKP